VITHKAVMGYHFPETHSERGVDPIIGCYECFDSANRAAINFVRYADKSASVTTVDGKLVVYYRTEHQPGASPGATRKLIADTGPSDLEERKRCGWDVPA
jgi:hypothetical protein